MGSISPASFGKSCELKEVIYSLIMMLNTRLNYADIIRKLELTSVGDNIYMSSEILAGFKAGSVIGISDVELSGHKGMVSYTRPLIGY